MTNKGVIPFPSQESILPAVAIQIVIAISPRNLVGKIATNEHIMPAIALQHVCFIKLATGSQAVSPRESHFIDVQKPAGSINILIQVYIVKRIYNIIPAISINLRFSPIEIDGVVTYIAPNSIISAATIYNIFPFTSLYLAASSIANNCERTI